MHLLCDKPHASLLAGGVHPAISGACCRRRALRHQTQILASPLTPHASRLTPHASRFFALPPLHPHPRLLSPFTSSIRTNFSHAASLPRCRLISGGFLSRVLSAWGSLYPTTHPGYDASSLKEAPHWASLGDSPQPGDHHQPGFLFSLEFGLDFLPTSWSF